MDQLCGTITYNSSATVYTLECELTGSSILLLANTSKLEFCEVTVEYKDNGTETETEEFAENNNGTVLLARREQRPPPPPPKSVKDAEDAASEGSENEGAETESKGTETEEESQSER